MTGGSHPVFFSANHEKHDPTGQPDHPARAARLLRAALDFGMVARQPDDGGIAPIAAVHSPGLLALLQTAHRRFAQLKEGPRPAIPDSFAVRDLSLPGMAGYLPRSIWGQLGHYCTDNLTPILEGTWLAAYWAAHTAVSAAMEIRVGESLAYALCRPPGHHAYRDMYGGYCYLNNAAIAAEVLTAHSYRPAILDIDYHHGNGTQAIFYDRADVFFCSLHADPADEYPYYCGFAHEVGRGEGEGATLNIPLPMDCDETSYLRAVNRGLDVISQYHPDVLVLSVGFDTLKGDPQGEMQLEPRSFDSLGSLIAQLNVPVLLIQEGGYLVESLGLALLALLEGLA